MDSSLFALSNSTVITFCHLLENGNNKDKGKAINYEHQTGETRQEARREMDSLKSANRGRLARAQ
jgi:hypothetical protein